MRRRLERMEREMRRRARRGAPLVPPRPRPLPAAANHRRRGSDPMDFNKLTIKSQEAVAAAQDDARRRGNPEITPDHLLLALLDQELFADWQGLRPDAERKVAALPSVQGGQQQPNVSAAFSRLLDQADDERKRLERRLRLDRAPVPRARAGAARRDRRVDRVGARRSARHLAGPRGDLPGARRSSAATSPRPPRRASSTR